MTRTGFEIQDLIGRLNGNHSWDALDELTGVFGHPERRKRSEEEAAKREAEKRSFQLDAIAAFSTPEGQRVLERLIAGTVGRPPVNFGSTGLSADQVGVMAAYRDGQNTVIHALLTDLAEAGFDLSKEGNT